MASEQWFVLDVNPYPWKVPPFSVGRAGARMFVKAGRDDGLHTYKEAIREQLERLDPVMIEGPVDLQFWFWRNIIKRGRSRDHVADATNMQKSTEDALQGILFENDSSVARVQSEIVAQGPSMPGIVVVRAAPMFTRSIAAPFGVRELISKTMKEQMNPSAAPKVDNNFYDPTRKPDAIQE